MRSGLRQIQSTGTIYNRDRAKMFGTGPRTPLNDAQKRRIMGKAYDLRRRQIEEGNPAALTRAALDVLRTLLWRFHNRKTGACFPSYERIAAEASCCESSVADALKQLEAAGILTWCNRLVRRTVEAFSELLGTVVKKTVPQRTSNAYAFTAPPRETTPPNTNHQSGTLTEDFKNLRQTDSLPDVSPLSDTLRRFKGLFDRHKPTS
jgi:hypothetical protein